MSVECQTAGSGTGHPVLDLPGPSRRITVEPVETPATKPVELPDTPEADPGAEPERRPEPDRRPEEVPAGGGRA